MLDVSLFLNSKVSICTLMSLVGCGSICFLLKIVGGRGFYLLYSYVSGFGGCCVFNCYLSWQAVYEHWPAGVSGSVV